MKQNDPKTILIGTRNKAKVDMIIKTFPEIGVKFISLNDIDEVDDSSLVEGMDFLENAKMKSKFYFDKTGIPTISTDQVPWLEHWQEDGGFIIHIRKLVNPQTGKASDEEVGRWIKNFVDTHGSTRLIFHFGVGYSDSKGTKGYNVVQKEYILQAEKSATERPGYIFDQFMKDPQTNQYRVDQPEMEAYANLATFFRDTFVPEIIK